MTDKLTLQDDIEDAELLAAVEDDGLDIAAEIGDDDLGDAEHPAPKQEDVAPQPAPNIEAQRLERVLAAQQAEADAKAHAEAAAQAAEVARKALLEAERKFQDGDDITPEDRLAAQERYQDAREAERAARAYQQQARQQVEAANQPINQAAAAWVAANPRFNTDQAFFDDAQRIEAEMNTEAAKRGMKWDWNSPATFAELDKRLKKPKAMQQRPSGPAPVSRGAGREKPQPDKPTSAEAGLMRRFGLNPNDKRHLAEWRHQKATGRQEDAA